MSLYKDAGIDVDKANNFVDKIRQIADTTTKLGVVSSIGGFGSVFDLKAAGFRDPLLVSGTDGVGSKLKLVQKYGYLSDIGLDLVSMSANDVLCHGAKPLFFLDYYAVGKLDIDHGRQIIQGIAYGCIRAGCSLVGGETAELPTMYDTDEWELAGFCVGAVERENLLPKNIKEGDSIIGISSNGLHANGYSMIQNPKTVPKEHMKSLLLPTTDYVRGCLAVMDTLTGLAHITGGGLVDNVPRIIPDGLCAQININWRLSELFTWIKNGGLTDGEPISDNEMLKTFNCGIGMVIILDINNEVKVCSRLNDFGHDVYKIGRVTKTKSEKKIKIIGELK